MKITEIKNIVRKDVPIYYKRFYKGIAILSFLNKNSEIPLEFVIEHKATGDIDINVTLNEQADYPLVPLLKELKNYIGELDSSNRLPA